MRDLDELTEVRDFRPQVPAPDRTTLATGRWKVMAAAHAETQGAARTARPAWVTAGRRTAVAGLAAAAVTAGVVLTHSSGTGSGSDAREQTVAQVLDIAARNAANAPTLPTPHADQWVYHRDKACVGRCTEARAWVRYSGGKYAVKGKTIHTGKRVVTAVFSSAPDYLSHVGGSPAKDAQVLAALPTDPKLLLREIHANPYFAPDEIGGAPFPAKGSRQDFVRIANTLQSATVIPPQVNAALYRALELIPGTTVADKPVKDAFGRTGVAVGYNAPRDHGKGDYVILDPKTYAFLGWQMSIAPEPGVPSVETFARSAVSYVDHPGQEPGGPVPPKNSIVIMPPKQ